MRHLVSDSERSNFIQRAEHRLALVVNGMLSVYGGESPSTIAYAYGLSAGIEALRAPSPVGGVSDRVLMERISHRYRLGEIEAEALGGTSVTYEYNHLEYNYLEHN